MRFFGVRTRKRRLRAGYFFCPKCYRRTPGEMCLIEDVMYVFGVIPAGALGASRNVLLCHSCGDAFNESDDWIYDFGEHAEPRVWDCRECGELNTNDRFCCRRCGRHI